MKTSNKVIVGTALTAMLLMVAPAAHAEKKPPKKPLIYIIAILIGL